MNSIAVTLYSCVCTLRVTSLWLYTALVNWAASSISRLSQFNQFMHAIQICRFPDSVNDSLLHIRWWRHCYSPVCGCMPMPVCWPDLQGRRGRTAWQSTEITFNGHSISASFSTCKKSNRNLPLHSVLAGFWLRPVLSEPRAPQPPVISKPPTPLERNIYNVHDTGVAAHGTARLVSLH